MIDQVVHAGFVVPAVLCWLGSVYCLAWLRDKPWNPAIAAILLSFVARGLAFGIGWPPGYEALDRFFGVANASRLLINYCGIVWSVAIVVALTFWSQDAARARTAARRWWLAGAAVIVVSTALWLRAEMPETAMSFSARNSHDESVAGYMLMYHASMTLGLVYVVFCCWRYGRLTDVTRLRVGMWITIAGALLYLSFCLHRIVGIIAQYTGFGGTAWPLASPMATGPGAILMMTGLTMPMWGARLAQARARRRMNRRYQIMAPLWRDLHDLSPSIRLPLDDTGDIEFRLYRRMVEIRDGLLLLAPHLPDTSPDGTPREVAGRIRDAVTACHDGPRPTNGVAATSGAALERHAEEDWLTAVSAGYARVRDRAEAHGRAGAPTMAGAAD